MNEKPVEEVPSGDVKAELKNQEQQLRLVCLQGKITVKTRLLNLETSIFTWNSPYYKNGRQKWVIWP